MSKNKVVRLVEVGPRDGLQNEKIIIPTRDKVKLIDLLSACGFKQIEVSSFVSAKWVPQLADAKDVMQSIKRHQGVRYAVLVPNLKGYELALANQADEIAIFVSASESFSKKNINCSIEESFKRYQQVCDRAKADNIRIRGYLSCVIECPYQGVVNPQDVVKNVGKLFDLGCDEVSLGDTIGAANKENLRPMLDAVCAKFNSDKLAGHFHDTNNNALRNVEISLDYGLRVFDCAIAGLGGCPYAPGAPGNLASEKLVNYLTEHGYQLDIDESKLIEVIEFINTLGLEIKA